MTTFDISNTPEVFEIGTSIETFDISTMPDVFEVGVTTEVFYAFTDYNIPSYANNKLAWDAGLRNGDLYKDENNKVRVATNPSNLILNLSVAWSYFMRGFR
jgi:hypothetical protein